MYLSYYNLKTKPFQISTDPEFLWLGEKHKEALATLKYAILENKGFLLLTGDIGTGKTTIINALVNSLGDEVIAAKVSFPRLETLDFFNFVADALKMNKKFASRGDFLVHLSHFLDEAYTNNKKVLLIIDEAQVLEQELLDDIRMLSNVERQHTKLINLFLVGSCELNDIVQDARNSALRQRIAVRYNIDVLTKNEVAEYVRYRLTISGSKKEIFDSGAMGEIFSFSNGYPRLINIICDHALLTGYVKGKNTINANIIKECAKELKIGNQGLTEKGDQEPVETTGEKPAHSHAAYIGLLVILLVIAGFLFYYGGEDEPPADESPITKTDQKEPPPVRDSRLSGETPHLAAERAVPRPHQGSEPPPVQAYETQRLKVQPLIPPPDPVRFDSGEKEVSDGRAQETAMPDIPHVFSLDIYDWTPD